MLLNVAAAMGLGLDCAEDGLSLRLLGGEKATALAALLREPANPTVGSATAAAG